MEEFSTLIKFIPDAVAVISVIIVVRLFLKQQDETNKTLEQITDKFNRQVEQSQKAFQEQINILSQQYYTNQKAFQDQIQLLIDAHMKVSKESIAAIKALEAAVAAVKEKVSKLPEQLNGPTR